MTWNLSSLAAEAVGEMTSAHVAAVEMRTKLWRGRGRGQRRLGDVHCRQRSKRCVPRVAHCFVSIKYDHHLRMNGRSGHGADKSEDGAAKRLRQERHDMADAASSAV
jgi:hypothetical protein